MKYMLILVFMISLSTFAQDAGRRDTLPLQQRPLSVPDTMTVTVRMSIMDYQKILGALSYMPFRDVSELIARIEQQLKTQIEARARQAGGRKN